METILLIILTIGIIAVLILAILILLALQRQSGGSTTDLLRNLIMGSEKNQSDALRLEAHGIRQEVQDNLALTRKELGEGMDRLRGNSSETQQQFQKAVQERLDKYSEALTSNSDRISSVLQENRMELVTTLQTRLEGLQKATAEAAEKQTTAMNEVRTKVTESVAQGLKEIQEKNEQKLEQMRLTVDEKLQNTLDTRLTQSFELVTKQLLEVQKGLSEMQNLAQDVGGLKKALTNVKVRGMLGEAQLGALLEQFLTREQYDENVAIKPRSAERVEYAVRLPGPAEGETLWLPIDSKFPIEDYQRLQDAYENGDKPAWEQAGKAFETRLYQHAADISSKYIDVPHSTEFALMFLPFESLYGEAIRRPGLFQAIQAKYHVAIVGPTTLGAFLNSLQVGFKTLAISKQSGEVWKVLGAVKTEFQKFGDAVSKVQKNLDSASSNLSTVSDRARQMEKKLGKVSALPSDEAMLLLPAEEASDEEQA
ncbi:MAG: DNA recombination protein RmuC [Rectinemataceae bacterium]